MLRDLVHAVRVSVRNPGFSAVVILLFSLGIGAATAIYGLIDRVLLRPLPVHEPERLVELADYVSYPDYQDLRSWTRSFSGLAGFEQLTVTLRDGDRVDQVASTLAAESYFPVLGVRMARGRGFLPEEGRSPGAASVAILSHDFWTRRFGADPGVLGRPLSLNGHAFTVVGVAPEHFRGTLLSYPTDVWIPLVAQPLVATGFLAGLDLLNDRGSAWHRVVGRLRDGVSLEQAGTEMATFAGRLRASYPDDHETEMEISLVPLNVAAAGVEGRDAFVRFLQVLAAVVALLLVITCANLANLLLVKVVGRSREMALRSALGAGRWPIVRQLLAESLLLSLLSGAGALLVAFWAMQGLASFDLPGSLPIGALDLTLGPRVVAFDLALSVVIGVFFGVLPVFHVLKPGLMRQLTQRISSAGSGESRLRDGLLVLQVALCLVLLIGGGLFVRSVRNAIATDFGFRTDRLVVASVDLGKLGYEKPRAADFYARLLERLEGRPGVEAASVSANIPLGSSRWRIFADVEGFDATREEVPIYPNVVEADYFRTLGIPIVRGRTFDSRDGEGAPQVAVVNETLARRFWPGQDPLGKTIVPFPGKMDVRLQVVGVARDSLFHGLRDEILPGLYVPVYQEMGRNRLLNNLNLLVRASGDAATATALLRQELRAMDPELAVADVQTFDDHLDQVLMPQRFGLTLLSFFGVLSLLLACVGIYAMATYSLRCRRREMGIRIALGAKPGDVSRLVLRRSLTPVLLGITLGVALALLTTRLVSAFLYDVGATDPVTFLLTALLLLAVALTACCIPALRAGKTDPVLMLQAD